MASTKLEKVCDFSFPFFFFLQQHENVSGVNTVVLRGQMSGNWKMGNILYCSLSQALCMLCKYLLHCTEINDGDP